MHVRGRESVVWARNYSQPKHAQCDCEVLEHALRLMPGMRRVVVGHTIQQPGGVNAACDGQVLRVDVGMSAGCGDAQPEVLEILRDGEGGISRLSLNAVTGAVIREPVAGVPLAPPPPPAPPPAPAPAVKAEGPWAGSYFSSLFGG